MKKKLTCLMGIAMSGVLLFTGCGSGSGGSSDNGSSSSGDTRKVAMIYNASINDGGWGSSCYSAMTDAAEELGWETAYTENVDTADYVSAITNYAELGYDLIYCPGNEYTDAVEEVAGNYPEVNFCLLNGTVSTDNIVSVMPDAEQIGYLAGALAGLMTNSNYIGFIGGMELDTTQTKLAAYEAAAKKVNPDVEVESAYAGSFDDSAKGKEIASSMISTYDVDVMFGDAGAVDTGAREALAEHADHYSIGQPGDLGSEDDSVIICSVVTDNTALLKQCMEKVESDSYGNETITGDLSNGGLSVGTFSNVVPEDIRTAYLEYVDQIEAGTFIQ